MSGDKDPVDISVAGDGGVMKVVLREGEGDATPHSFDEVTVHYEGYLAGGEKFDSSRDRGEEFVFKHNDGRVIKGWDLAVATMKRGELCRITCKPEYGYGNKGSPPTIPAGATLAFEIELLGWKGEDLTGSRDGGIIRRILEKGTGDSSPNHGALVTVNIRGSHDGRIFDEREVTYQAGYGFENSIINGIDRAVKKFHKGENSQLLISNKYAYGETGSPEFGIPSDATVEFDLTLIDFTRAKEHWEMSATEKISYAEENKAKGTTHFKEGKISYALIRYQKGKDILDDAPGYTEEELRTKRILSLTINLNCSLCHLKLEQWNKALHCCTAVLNIESHNEKALYRKAQALIGRKDYDEAVVILKELSELYPDNGASKKLILTAKKLKKEDTSKIKDKYSGMFQKFADEDSKAKALKQAAGAMSDAPIGYWSNSMADGMLSLQQEMEAFGERMPERSRRSSHDDNETTRQG